MARGRFDAARGTIEAPIGRDPRNPTRMVVDRSGRDAVTHYRRAAGWEDRDRVGAVAGVVGVEADRRDDIVVAGGDVDRGQRGRSVAPDGHEGRHAGEARRSRKG